MAMAATVGQVLSLRIDRQATGTAVVVGGEVDRNTAPQLAAALDDAATGPAPQVEVDLSGVGFFSCAGATAVELADRHARSRGGRLRVRGAGREARLVLDLAGLDRLVQDGQARPA